MTIPSTSRMLEFGSSLARQYAAATTNVAQQLAAAPGASPEGDGDGGGDRVQELSVVRLADNLRPPIERLLTRLDLSLVEFSRKIPDYRRRLTIDRAGANGFVQLPPSIAADDRDTNIGQILLLERTFQKSEIRHLLIFTTAETIHSHYSRYIFRRWTIQKSFDLVEAYNADDTVEFLGLPEDEQIERLRLVLLLNGGVASGPTLLGPRDAPSTLSDAQMGELMAIIGGAFSPGTFKTFVDFKLEGRKLHEFQGPSDNFPQVIANVVSRANEENWIELLLTKLRSERPNNSNLASFCDGLDLPASAGDED